MLFDINITDKDMLHCLNRLSQIEKLEDGWHSGSGLHPGPIAILNAWKLIESTEYLCGRYLIYPTYEGGILFEFSVKNWEISIELFSNGNVQIYAIDSGSERNFEPIDFNGINTNFFNTFNELTNS